MHILDYINGNLNSEPTTEFCCRFTFQISVNNLEKSKQTYFTVETNSHIVKIVTDNRPDNRHN